MHTEYGAFDCCLKPEDEEKVRVLWAFFFRERALARISLSIGIDSLFVWLGLFVAGS